ncbi:MAG: Cell division protein ftsA [Parcubacteria group bacterium GW2011_GWB1_40_5]|nr:MAG: Cell division protein ftsA [Parcubacteria group bacterium GW2011_GWB1_40_5]OHA86540.1 MAG: cell division protein FtsA [Candidatus Zambryskibacteria bacterium GWB1_40_5]
MMRNTTVGIDIGTHQIKVVVTELVRENEKLITKVIGTGLSESKGLRHGYIVNSDDVVESLSIAIKQAEKTSGIKVRKAFVAIGGIGLTAITGTASVVISRADLQITELDIKKLNEICEEELPSNLIQNYRILHSIPIQYKIDGKIVLAKSPLDMKGTKLEVKMLFVICLEPHLNSLLEAVDEAGVEIMDCLASPIASSFVNVSKSQKMAGCVLVNIGSETVSLVVFENNIPISLEVFPVGSTDITNDIALGLKITPEDAENIKVGSIGSSSYPKKKIDEIISARLYDIFELIESHLKKMGRNELLPAGIFITGGGSSTTDIEDFAKTALKLPARIATINLGGQKTNIKDSIWAVACRLCMVGASNEEKINVGLRSTINKAGGKIGEWIKQFLP